MDPQGSPRPRRPPSRAASLEPVQVSSRQQLWHHGVDAALKLGSSDPLTTGVCLQDYITDVVAEISREGGVPTSANTDLRRMSTSTLRDQVRSRPYILVDMTNTRLLQRLEQQAAGRRLVRQQHRP
jgi:hypothetical protein